MKRISHIVVFIFSIVSGVVFSQTKISGTITDTKGNKVTSANIVLENSANQSIVAYTYSNTEGAFSFSTESKGNFSLRVSALGYATDIRPLVLIGEDADILITLQEQSFDLEEITISAPKPITIKKDTIIINAKSFSKVTDEVVEDLLKNVPGINVDEDGTIKIGNQEVEKVMIEGDDFFEKGYKLLTKSMPSQAIDKIEVLNQYSNNRLLKGIEQSNKIALNLTLDEKAKRQWFGNADVRYGIGSDNRYEAQGNLMNFGKKNKYYFLTNLNNIGYETAGGDVSNLIRSFSNSRATTIGHNQKAAQLLSLKSSPPNLKRNKSNFNNTELLSLNGIFNPTEKLKIKALGFLNFDEQDVFRNTRSNYFFNDINFSNTENYRLREKQKQGFGKLEFIYDVSPHEIIESISQYDKGNRKTDSQLNFNEISTQEELQTDTEVFDQKVSYTNKYKENKVLQVTGRYITELLPQNYRVNQFFFQGLFPNITDAESIQQSSENKMSFMGIEGHILDRKENDNLLQIKLGNTLRRDNLQSRLLIENTSGGVTEPNGYQNNLNYRVNDTYVTSKYRWQLGTIGIVSKIDAHLLSNKITSVNKQETQSPFFINPTIGIDWKISDNNKITSTYSLNRANVDVLTVFDNYVATNSRSLVKGTGDFNQLNASSLVINHQLGNWLDKTFINTFILYTKNHDFISTNTIINPSYTQSEKIIVKDRGFINISSNIDRFIKKIKSNVKINLGFSRSNYKNSVNNSPLRNVKSKSYNYGIEVRSGFKGFFNYHIGTRWQQNNIISSITNSYTNNISFVDASFSISEDFNVQFESERHYFGNLDSGNNIYYFLDANAKYIVKRNKLSLSLTGKNLFDTDTFRDYSIDDISESTTEYRLLPRFVLLGMKYRF